MSRITTNIDTAKAILEAGDVIGFPTETVYGLAALVNKEEAIHKIYELKGRPKSSPLIAHISGIEELTKVAQEIPEIALKLAENFWPGPLTIILNKKESISKVATARKNTIGVRVPNHPVALELLRHLSCPLVAPSANPFGMISPTSAQHVDGYFDSALPLILDGGVCSSGLESTIVGFDSDSIIVYRLGGIPLSALEKFNVPVRIENFNEKSPQAPGMSLRHYAPKTDIILTDQIDLAIAEHRFKEIGVIVFSDKYAISGDYPIEVLSAKGDFDEAGKNLYAAMHRLDQLNLDLIISERLPDENLGLTINDRLTRATHH